MRIFDLGGLVVFKGGRWDKDAAWKGKEKCNGGWAEIEDQCDTDTYRYKPINGLSLLCPGKRASESLDAGVSNGQVASEC